MNASGKKCSVSESCDDCFLRQTCGKWTTDLLEKPQEVQDAEAKRVERLDGSCGSVCGHCTCGEKKLILHPPDERPENSRGGKSAYKVVLELDIDEENAEAACRRMISLITETTYYGGELFFRVLDSDGKISSLAIDQIGK